MRIGIVGITGRMGKVLAALTSQYETKGISGKTSEEKIHEIIKTSDVIIDFSIPTATLKIIKIATEYRIPYVIGTTGFSFNEFSRIDEASRMIPVLHASNFSVGIQLMANLMEKSAEIFPDFDMGIMEKHHRGKKDSPSGTTLFLAKHLPKEPQIASLREGNIFGEHTCDFVGENEMISITHRVFNRGVFAEGALKCAHWIVGNSPGLYSMRDYLESVVNAAN
ncbi:MAG: 4-hydroxy-tetrahydrodipicolinate reductase [Holosporaceae bacterium]|jgi:4-hydroxy-tetrahydrodipicolinate reductase|nr:4-hydroxy-tetrahydrodipicolinate reductase [Holosporaceae bacterium]